MREFLQTTIFIIAAIIVLKWIIVKITTEIILLNQKKVEIYKKGIFLLQQKIDLNEYEVSKIKLKERYGICLDCSLHRFSQHDKNVIYCLRNEGGMAPLIYGCECDGKCFDKIK